MLTDFVNDRAVLKKRHISLRDDGPYSARNTSKGALIEEAARLFCAISSGLTIEQVREQTLRGTLLTQRSSQNRKRIWTLLQLRYLVPELPWITRLLAEKSGQGAQSAEFVSLLYVLYALRDRLAFDFVTTVLWTKGYRNRPNVSRNDVLDLLKEAPHEPQVDRWSEATRIKLAGSVLTALRDFGVLEGSQKKYLIQPKLHLSTASALLRILVAEGCRGRRVLEDPAWRLFLLTEAQVAQFLARIAQEGTIRFERAQRSCLKHQPSGRAIHEYS